MSEPHVHYWIIDPPGRAESQGTCKTCGEVRTFKNVTNPSVAWQKSVKESVIEE